jgi:hypothetical protein
MLRILLTVWVLAIGQMGSAWATVISYSTAFGIGDSYSDPVAGNYSVNLLDTQFLNLPRFDSTLGTLQAAQVSFSSSYFKGIFELGAYDDFEETDFSPLPPFTGNDRNDTSITATVDASYQIVLFDPSSSSRTLNTPALQASCFDDTRDGNGDVSCQTSPVSASGGFGGTLPTGAINLMDFIGPDPLDLYVLLTGSLDGSCDSDDRGDACYVSGGGAVWSGTVSVSYTYDDDGGNGTPGGGGNGGGTTVPEPGTYLLFLIGFAALALGRPHGPSKAASLLS